MSAKTIFRLMLEFFNCQLKCERLQTWHSLSSSVFHLDDDAFLLYILDGTVIFVRMNIVRNKWP